MTLNVVLTLIGQFTSDSCCSATLGPWEV